MTREQCYVCEQTVLQCSRTMLLAMTYDLCHGGHMVAEYPLLHTPRTAEDEESDHEQEESIRGWEEEYVSQPASAPAQVWRRKPR